MILIFSTLPAPLRRPRLLQDKRNFIRDPPPGSRNFEFEYEKMYPVALATLVHDERLQQMRFELVPKRCGLVERASIHFSAGVCLGTLIGDAVWR